MSDAIFITVDGVFEIDGRVYRIPEHFSPSEVHSYRALIVPLPDKRPGTTLAAEQREITDTFFYRRAAACVIPEFRENAPESLSRDQLLSIHRWIGRHRPTLG
ncbi:MAG: hypothetical protein R3195_11605 [Gemmatimonadota bacterium]|nr:hypothetical protein [Gemmatimonadota bacterium]